MMESRWARVAELSTESLTDLAANRVAAVRIPAFATPDECRAMADALADAPLSHYKVGRPAGYVGMTFIQYMNNKKSDYFDNVSAAFASVDKVTSRSFDPLARFIDVVQTRTTFSAAVAQEPGYGSYFAGIIRVLSGGNNIHIDYAPQFAKDHVVGGIAAQLTWNVYIDEPAAGGETTIWNQPWMPTGNPEEDSKYPHFTEEGLEGVESFVFKAQPGSVMIFNSRNPHQVAITTGEDGLNRIGFGSFVGLSGDRDLVLWS